VRVALLTREYPPFVYGGAGVHVDFLSRELRGLCDLDVHCMGERRSGAIAHADDDPRFTDPVLRAFSADLSMVAAIDTCDAVHSHTWYTNLAGHLVSLRLGVPHVVTAHSLEPHRPWKAEQLGGGYQLSLWAERTAFESAAAVIAVSAAMKADVARAYPSVDPARIHVVHNGIDASFYRPVSSTDVLTGVGVDLSRPYVAFVGRITRQKGVPHLLRAALQFDPSVQLVLLAGAADTPELAAETDAAVAVLRASRTGVFWCADQLPPADVREVLSHAACFVCPSVYEPQGIVNLEAMACETAVVASDVGGIPEVVVDGETGLLVHYDDEDPAAFERDLAAAVNTVVADSARAAAMGAAGRARAVQDFAWSAIAGQVLEVYAQAIG
jgi:starch synthase